MVVKIGVNDLLVGMYVVDTGLSWMEHPYLYSREGRISSEKHLTALKKEGYAEAFIDTKKSGFDDATAKRLCGGTLFAEAFAGKAPRSTASASGIAVPMERELPAAKKIYEDALSFAKDFIHKAYLEKNVDVERSEKFVDDVITSVGPQTGGVDGACASWGLRRNSYPQHQRDGVDTAFAGSRPAEAEMRSPGAAALFNDVGKANSPSRCSTSTAGSTKAEFTVMMRPSLVSYAILGHAPLNPWGLRPACQQPRDIRRQRLSARHDGEDI